MRCVNLKVEDSLLSVHPAPPDVFNCLRTVEHRLVQDGHCGSHLESVPRVVFDEVEATGDGCETLTIGRLPAGLTPVATHLLHKKGYRTRGPVPAKSLPGPNPDALLRPGLGDLSLLPFLQYQNRGVIYTGREVDSTLVLAQMALGFPELSMVVATATLDEAQGTARSLRRWLSGAVTQLRSDRAPRTLQRIVVGNYEALLANCNDLGKRQLLVVTDALTALGKRGMDLLNGANQARVFGMLPHGQPLAPLDADHIRMVFGFHECYVPRHGYIPLPVDVVFEDDVRRRRGSRAKGLRSCRSLIWQNTKRNRRIARLGRALQSGDQVKLSKFPRTAKVIHNYPTERLAILADNLEQGIDLAKRLPDWPLAMESAIHMPGLTKRDQSIVRKNRRRLWDTPMIFTRAVAEKIDLLLFDVLIRADAVAELPPMQLDMPALLPNVNRRLLVVDFDDCWHHQVRGWTKLRRQAYRQHGWYSPGANPVEERVKDFLATRPDRLRN